MIVGGILLPMVVAWFAWKGYHTELMEWRGRAGSVTLRGESAKAMAACYLAGAGMAHFTWFWAERNARRVFTWGAIVSILLGVAGAAILINREFLY